MLAVHQETGLTGRFRFWRGKLQCQVIVTVRRYGHVIERYHSWRVANENDVFRAWFHARHANDNEQDATALLARRPF